MRFLKKVNLLLVLVLITAFYLRFSGCKPGFPPYHADEPMSYSSAFTMLKDHSLDPGRYDYPSLVPLLHAISYLVFFIPARSLWEGYLFTPQLPEDVFYWSRYFTAFLGTATVSVIYLIGKKLFNKKVGLLAAVILTFNYRHVLNSHFGLPDIPNGLILSLSFLSTLYLLEKPTWERYTLNGILMGLSFSTKYQVFAVPPFLLAHFFLVLQNTHDRKKIVVILKNSSARLLGKTIDKKFLVAVLLVPFVFTLLNSYFFQNLQLALHQIKDVSLKYGVGRWKFYDFPYYYLFHIGIGRSASIAILLGMIVMLFKNFKKWLLLMSVVTPFFFVLTFYSRGGFYVRNFVTIISLLTIFGGWVVYKISRVVTRFNPKGFLNQPFGFLTAAALTILIIMMPLKNSLVLIQAYQDDYNFRKVNWFINYKIPDDVKIAAHSSVPIPVDKKIERVNFEQKDYYTLRELQEADVDFAVTNTYWDSNHFYFWMGGDGPYENFGQVPKEYLANIFPALALSEVYQYSVAEFIKPWQAPESNFSVIKVPPLPKIESKKLKKELNLDVNKQSLLIPVEFEDKVLVSARVKNLQKIEQGKKDGLLRVDLLDSVGFTLSTHLGSRVFGEPRWQEKQVYFEVPEGVSSILVSFMVDNVNTGEFLIEDVKVYEVEVEEAYEPYQELPYIEPKMDLDLLFPKSML